MPTLALGTEEGIHIGFLLLSGGDTFTQETEDRECIFTGIPFVTPESAHPLSQFLSTYKHLEFICTVTCRPDQLQGVLRIPDQGPVTFKIELPAQKGTWDIEIPELLLQGAQCKLLPPSNREA